LIFLISRVHLTERHTDQMSQKRFIPALPSPDWYFGLGGLDYHRHHSPANAKFVFYPINGLLLAHSEQATNGV